MSLVSIDTKSEASVVMLLEHVHDWLSTAVERNDVTEIANVKAQMATVVEATKQLDLSKEIQLDSQEMLRQSEYKLAKAIRKAQAEGTVAQQGQSRNFRSDLHPGGNEVMRKIDDIVSYSEWQSGGANPGIAALADVDAAVFDAAVETAKDEGNLSRANVVRKIKNQQGPVSREDRALLIEELALQGYTSRQMPSRVGVTEETVRDIARAFDVDIPADRTSLKTKRINPAHVVENTATALEGLAMGIGLIDLKDVDPTVASQWVDSLTESMRALNRFVRQLKEQTQ